MTKLTKEFMQDIISGNGFGLAPSAVTEMARQLIASMEQEPVLYAAKETLAYAKMGELHLKCLSQPMGDAVIPLYVHRQATDEIGSWNNHMNTPTAQAGNSPVTQDGYVLVPKKLTAENGAKSALSGEFSETKFINCPECFGDDDCETCDGSGRIEITVPVTWTTIKAIWAKGVEHFAAAPKQENV